MTKLKQEIDDTNEKLEQCEGLVNKLENEVIEWDSLKKLCRRDEELNEIDVLVKDFDADLSKENTTMQALLEKNESKLENSTQQKDIEDFTYLVEGIKAYQVDIQKL
jgi:Rad3-related DNA helicase